MDEVSDSLVRQLLEGHPDCVRTVARFQRGKKVINLEDFVESLQAFVREHYDHEAIYREMKRRAINFFKAAKDTNIASYRLGRRRRPTRLIWKIDPSQFLGRAAAFDVDVRAFLQSNPKEWSSPVQPKNEERTPMQLLTHSDIADDVRRVLEQACRGKGARPQLMSAYQILDRLPQREQLIAERGLPGKEAGVHHAAASVVRDAIRFDLKDEVETFYFDNVGVVFEIGEKQVRAGFPVCGLYRISDGASAEV